MKVITSVTIEVKGEKGRETLPPGEHDLPAAVATELIEGGHAQATGKAAKAEPAGNPGSGQSDQKFDVSLLEGTVPDITSALQAGNLTADQLDALAAAEQEREKPRVGVIEAIAQAKQALAGK